MSSTALDLRDATPPSVDPAAPPADAPQPAWPWYVVLLAAPFTPARAVRHSRHLRLGGLVLIHLAGWLLVWGTAEYLYWLDSHRVPHRTLTADALEELPWILGERYWAVYMLLGLLIAAGIDAGVLAVGALFSSWGARDEKVRTTFGRGVRRGVLLSGHWWMTILLFGASVVHLEHLSRDYYQELNQSQPQLRGANPTAAELTEWRQELNEWHQRAYRARPWYLRWMGELLGSWFAVLATWQLWALLRAVGVGTPGFASPRPPVCSRCAYDLAGTPPDGRCPECGDAVAASLGPAARPGAPWEQRARVGRLLAALRTSRSALGEPFELGRRLRITSPDAHHRGFLLLMLMAIAVGSPLLFLGLVSLMVVLRHVPWVEWVEVLAIGFPLAASLAGIALGLSVLGGGLMGWMLSWRWRRPMIETTIRAACYASPVLLLMAVVFCIEFGTLPMLSQTLQNAFGRNHDEAMALVIFGPQVLLLLWLWLVTYRITAGARHAVR